jgi:hypothetical protein
MHERDEQRKALPQAFILKRYEVLRESGPDLTEEGFNVSQSIIEVPCSFAISLDWGVEIALSTDVPHVRQLLVPIGVVPRKNPHLRCLGFTRIGRCEVPEVKLRNPVLVLGSVPMIVFKRHIF